MLDEAAAERLAQHVWQQVRADLRAGHAETLAWLSTDDFIWWAEVTLGSEMTPAELRERLLAAFSQAA